MRNSQQPLSSTQNIHCTQKDIFGDDITIKSKSTYKVGGKKGKISVKRSNRVEILSGLLLEIGLEKNFTLSEDFHLNEFTIVKTFEGNQPVGEKGSFIRELLISNAVEKIHLYLINEFAERDEDESFLMFFEVIFTRLRMMKPHEDVNVLLGIIVNYLMPYGNNPKSVRDVERTGYRLKELDSDIASDSEFDLPDSMDSDNDDYIVDFDDVDDDFSIDFNEF